jgi:hypothetical protein
MTNPIPAAALARDLGMLQPDDVEVYISEVLGLDLHDEDIPAEVAADVRTAFNPHGERTAPARLYWPGNVETDEIEGEGIGARSPVRGEGHYPPL